MKKGFSLIVLIITIIVMLIISGITIMLLSKSNPIQEAKNARLREDLKTISSETGMYMVREYKNDVPKYPVTTVVKAEDINVEIKEYIAILQGQNLITGLPDINAIDFSKVYYLDTNIIKSAKKYDKRVLFSIGKEGRWDLIYLDGILVDEKMLYAIKEILQGQNQYPKFIATYQNTYKISTKGALSCVGQKNSLSGATDSEIEAVNERNDVELDVPFKDYKLLKVAFGTACVIDKDNNLWAYGDNYQGKIGTGDEFVQTVPFKVTDNVKDVFIGQNGLWVLKTNGDYYVTGVGYTGNFAANPPVGYKGECAKTNFTEAEVEKIYQVYSATYVQMKDRTIWATGMNYYGIMGTNEHASYNKPINYTEKIKPFGIDGYKEFIPTGFSAIFVLPDGRLKYTGSTSGMGQPTYGEHGDVIKKFIDLTPEMIGITSVDEIQYVVPQQWCTNIILKDGTVYNAVDGRPFRVLANKANNIKKIIGENEYLGTDNSTYILPRTDNSITKNTYKQNNVKSKEGDLVTTLDGKHYVRGNQVINYREKISQTKLKPISNYKVKQITRVDPNLFIINKDYELIKYPQDKKVDLENIEMITNRYILFRNGDLCTYTNWDMKIKETILKNVAYVTHLSNNVVALTKDNKLYYWGESHYWENVPTIPGRDTSQDISKPTLVDPSDTTIYTKGKIKQIAVRERDTSVLMEDGTLYICSSYYSDKGDFIKHPFPKKVEKIIASTICTYAVLENGDVYAWGDNKKNVFGGGYNIGWHAKPVRLKIPEPMVDVSPGREYTIFLAETGNVYAVGQNIYGQFGTGDFKSSTDFVRCKYLEEN